MRPVAWTVGNLVVAAVAVAILSGCPKPSGTYLEPPGAPPEYDRPLPPGKLALAKITDPKDIPDFTQACANTAALRPAIENSLHYLAKHSSQRAYPYGAEITHEQVVATLQEFLRMIDANFSPSAMNAAIRSKFDVYTSVGWNGKGGVLFTGYYTPIFDASPTKTDKFRYPLYKQPPGLVKDDEGNVAGVKGDSGAVTKLPPREEIERTTMFAGQELYWLGDPFEVYIAHVQGSAKLRLPDGSLVTVGYCASNGWDYVSIGKIMVAEGKFPKGGLSLGKMIEYFHAHPGEVDSYTRRNPRFVFFSVLATEPCGCLNEPVTPWRSIATDKTIFPRAAMAFLATTLPRSVHGQIEELPYQGFALDQDAGNAIRAAGRADIYMGVGDKAGELAGRTQKEGRLYYVFLKHSEIPQAPAAVPAAPVKETPRAAPKAAPKEAPKATPKTPAAKNVVIPRIEKVSEKPS